MQENMSENQNTEKWVSDETYEKVRAEIEQWPDWKKRAYNEMFATSKHAKKV